MNARVTAGLFVVLLVLLGVVFLMQQGGGEPTPVPTVTPAAALFAGVDISQVQRLEVSGSADRPALVLERGTEDDWLLVTPAGTEPITATITSQISSLVTLSARNTLPSTANPLNAYGLDEPSHVITLVASAGDAYRRYVLNVGHETPTADGYYVMRDGDPRIYVVLKFPVDSVLGLVDTLAATPTPPAN